MVDISYIEHFTDNLGKVRQHTTPKRKGFGIKRTKYLGILAVLLIIGAVTGFGAIFTFFVQHETTVTSSEALLTWDDGTTVSDAEDLQVGETLTSFVGGDSEEFIYWLNYSSDADSSIDIDIQWLSGNVSGDGFTAEFYNWSASGWGTPLENDVLNVDRTLTLAPGDSTKIKLVYSLDEKAEEDSYDCTLLID